MLPSLTHRGPDNEDLHLEPGLAFGHRRLSIIDLSSAGHQPMEDPELDLVITYNGEIYNHGDLRSRLEARGYRFFSDSDTEVLLKAYDAWGDRFVERLNGMFAFCLHDRQRGRYLLVRDRLGIKPLYYCLRDHRLYFASNIQALAAAGVLGGEISPRGLHYYLTFHAVIPAPDTIFAEVRKLEPGTVLAIDSDGGSHGWRYWDVDFTAKDELDEGTWTERILEVLRTGVRRRLVSDVPVGALLSGGTDSSLIVALMAEEIASFRTYSIGFEDAAGEGGSEFAYSDLVAERFGTEHRKIFIESRRLLPSLQQCVASMAEPMVSHDAVGFFLLAEEVSKETKVVLSGQGADELFGGYHWYPKIEAGGGDPVDLYSRYFFDRRQEEIREAVGDGYRLSEDVARAFVRQQFDRHPGEAPVDRAMRLDTTVMLADDPVKRVDNMTMAWGLEARVPFLDHEVVELAARIPARLKLHPTGKSILKKAAERVVPREVIYREKGYFPVPALKYLRGEYLDFARDVLLSHRSRERGLFRQAYVDRLLKDPEEHLTALGGSKLWQVALLEFWLQQLGA